MLNILPYLLSIFSIEACVNNFLLWLHNFVVSPGPITGAVHGLVNTYNKTENQYIILKQDISLWKRKRNKYLIKDNNIRSY